MTKLQQRVAEFARENQLEADVPHRLLDVVAELGELSKEALKGSRYGATTFIRTGDWEEEVRRCCVLPVVRCEYDGRGCGNSRHQSIGKIQKADCCDRHSCFIKTKNNEALIATEYEKE